MKGDDEWGVLGSYSSSPSIRWSLFFCPFYSLTVLANPST